MIWERFGKLVNTQDEVMGFLPDIDVFKTSGRHEMRITKPAERSQSLASGLSAFWLLATEFWLPSDALV